MITIRGKKYNTLTTQQRNQYYRKAFEELPKRILQRSPWLCNSLAAMLRSDLNDGHIGRSVEIVRWFFPELHNLLDKTDGFVLAWPVSDKWNAHRADVLATCIEQTNAM